MSDPEDDPEWDELEIDPNDVIGTLKEIAFDVNGLLSEVNTLARRVHKLTDALFEAMQSEGGSS